MSSTCTITIHSQSAMASALSRSPSFSRRYTRAQSSPARPSFPQSKQQHSPGSSSSSSSEKSIAESVSMLAALPSLSKSLNHLPTLGGQNGKDIPVYEGMPSVAQKSSHEKLRTALGKSSPCKDALAKEKNGFYSSAFFSMTPVHGSSIKAAPTYQSRSQPGYVLAPTHQKQKTFSLYAEEEDEEEDVEDA